MCRQGKIYWTKVFHDIYNSKCSFIIDELQNSFVSTFEAYLKRLFVPPGCSASVSSESLPAETLKDRFERLSLDEILIDLVIHDVVSEISSTGSSIDGTCK